MRGVRSTPRAAAGGVGAAGVEVSAAGLGGVGKSVLEGYRGLNPPSGQFP